MSSRVSTSTDDASSNRSLENMSYQPLSFENDLFTARVYKRNYRNTTLLRPFKNSTRMKAVAGHSACVLKESRLSPRNQSISSSESQRLTTQANALTHGIYEMQPLHLAERAGSPDVVQRLFAQGAQVSANNILGEQSIHLAAASGPREALQIPGPSIACLDNFGHQPIHQAMALIAVAEKAEAVGSALSQFTDHVAESSTEITTLVAQCFSTSLALRRLHNTFEDYLYPERYRRIIIDVNTVRDSLEYTFRDAQRYLRKDSIPHTTYRRVWNEFDDYLKTKVKTL